MNKKTSYFIFICLKLQYNHFLNQPAQEIIDIENQILVDLL